MQRAASIADQPLGERRDHGAALGVELHARQLATDAEPSSIRRSSSSTASATVESPGAHAPIPTTAFVTREGGDRPRDLGLRAQNPRGRGVGQDHRGVEEERLAVRAARDVADELDRAGAARAARASR